MYIKQAVTKQRYATIHHATPVLVENWLKKGIEMTSYIDLVVDNGELVRIECPEKYFDECHESLTNAMKRRDWWSPLRFDGCKAEYMGMHMERVSMDRVVGML